MSKLLLLLLLIPGNIFSLFSQNNEQFKKDTTVYNLSLEDGQKTHSLVDTVRTNKFKNNSSVSEKKLCIKSLKEDQWEHKSNDTIKILIEPQRYDNMPIVQPEGSFSMPVEKPDSTVNNTLLIKKR